MKILIISPEFVSSETHTDDSLDYSLAYSGENIGRYVYELILDLLGYLEGVTVITRNPAGDATEPVIETTEGIKVFRFAHPASLSRQDERTRELINSYLYNFTVFDHIKEITETMGPLDLIHTHHWPDIPLGPVLKEISGVPMVTTVHATCRELGRIYNSKKHKYLAEREKLLFETSDHIICRSKTMSEEVQKYYLVEPGRISIVPDAVDLEFFHRYGEIQQELKEKQVSGEKVILFVGKLSPEKGILDLLQAFPLICQEIPEARLIICGRGELEGEINGWAYSLNIHDKVLVIGTDSPEERREYYALADVAVFPSLYEPSGTYLLESLAAKTAAVVSGTGILGELIQDRVNGLLFTPGNYEDIARKIIWLLKEEQTRKELAEKGYETAKAYNNRLASARKTFEIYQSITAGAKSRPQHRR